MRTGSVHRRKPYGLAVGFFESSAVLLILFIVVGSLYPFKFDSSLSITRMQGLSVWPGRSDLLANLVLFFPLGFAAGLLRSQLSRATTVAAGLLVAIGCQIAQIYIQSRTPALWDAIVNAGGLAIGLSASYLVHREGERRPYRIPLSGFVIILVFLGYQLAPFAPSIDIGLLKQSFKRLLGSSVIDFEESATAVAYVLILAGVLRSQLPHVIAFRVLTGVVGVALLLKPITAASSTSIAELTGLMLGVAIACKLPYSRKTSAALAALALALYVFDGVTPFQLRLSPVIPDLSPIAVLIGGSWLATITALLWKSFVLLSAMILMCIVCRGNMLVPAGIVILATIAVEGTQIFVASGVPSTLDIVLAVSLAAMNSRSSLTCTQTRRSYGRNDKIRQAMGL